MTPYAGKQCDFENHKSTERLPNAVISELLIFPCHLQEPFLQSSQPTLSQSANSFLSVLVPSLHILHVLGRAFNDFVVQAILHMQILTARPTNG